ncbi:MAG: hypothetical protein PHD21_02365 [Flavobacteriales bacterium]|nr:hypothetical protein [Flavobacteriales bacterium]
MNQRKNIVSLITSYAFLGIFLMYMTGTSFFSHSHVINGCTIVHSHFYKDSVDKNGHPVQHQHTKSELTLIFHISSFDKVASSVDVIIPEMMENVFVHTQYAYHSLHTQQIHYHILGRSPPFILV